MEAPTRGPRLYRTCTYVDGKFLSNGKGHVSEDWLDAFLWLRSLMGKRVDPASWDRGRAIDRYGVRHHDALPRSCQGQWNNSVLEIEPVGDFE